MKIIKRQMFLSAIFSAAIFLFCMSVNAQNKMSFEVLTDAALTKVVPTSFYFAGQSAQTQARNTAAAKLGKDRFVVVGLVDTSGYSTEISGKYEGFFITDSPLTIGDKMLDTGAYGFGFSANGNVNIFDLSSKQILSVATKSDAEMKRPRPLQMTQDAKGVRFYKGKNYVLITPK
ncbi:MAG: hypothetical protein ABJA66_03275 [Actinomycetota bacterium]